ncbi:MAG: ABC transporter permease [Halobacteriaceae archaeon]
MRRRTVALGAAVAAWVAALAYDVWLPAGTPTLSWWDVRGIEWLFGLAFVVTAGLLGGPLVAEPRRARRYWRRFRRDRVAVASLAVLALLLVAGLAGPAVVGPPRTDFSQANLPPVGTTTAADGGAVHGTLAHPLGTDAQGRDVLVLLLAGARVSLEVGLVSAALAVGVGTLVGTTAALAGGRVDEALMRYVDLQQSLPVFVLLVLLVYLYGSSLVLVVLAYGLLGWERIARLVRAETLQRRTAGYVRAAEAAGASRWWVLRRHVLPNASTTVITAATLAVPAFVLGEAALSFLELGPPDAYSWGRTITAGRQSLATAPWVSTAPGVALFLTVLALNYVGEGLRDALDPASDRDRNRPAAGDRIPAEDPPRR